MKGLSDIGKIISLAGTTGGLVTYSGLLTSESDRKVLLTADWGRGGQFKKTNSSKRHYQRVPLDSAQFAKGGKYGKSYELMLKTGIVNSKEKTGDYKLMAPFGVGEFSLFLQSDKNKYTSSFKSLEEQDLNKFFLAAFKTKRSVGVMLLTHLENSSSNFEVLTSKNQKEIVINKFLMPNEEGYRVSVGRDTISMAKNKGTTKYNVYKNYGELFVGGSKQPNVAVLDLQIFGEEGLKFQDSVDKVVLQQKRSGNKKAKASKKGWWFFTDQVIEWKLFKLNEVILTNEGIEDVKGNQIKWITGQKPTFTTTLEK